MTYKSVIAIADKYNIPDDVLDIIFKYVYRNNIKRCTDRFTNDDFVRMMMRCYKNDSIHHHWRHYVHTPFDKINKGRYIIRQIYPKSFNPGRLTKIKFYNEKNIYIGPIKYRTRKNGHPFYRQSIYNKQLNGLYYKEELGDNYDIQSRADLIEILDFKRKVDEAFNKKPYQKFKKNMKTKDYIPLLMEE